jgi:hypothetical protein
MRLGVAFAIALGLSFPASAGISSQPAESAAQTGQSPTTPANAQTPAATENVPPRATTKHRKRASSPPGTPRKIVVREGGASEPEAQIVPSMPPAEAAHQRQNAEQWLRATDGELKQLAERKLTPQQQETVGQIRNYIDGAHGALKEGDVRRASTLAEKAHLLSDDLLHH